MRLDTRAQVCGQPAFKVRDTFRSFPYGASDAFFARKLDVPLLEAKKFTLQMAHQGFLERDHGNSSYWTKTVKGNALTNAKAFKPGAKPLDAFLSRVAHVNADDYFAYVVKEVLVFGSYLTDAEGLGDLDLAVVLEKRFADDARQTLVENESRNRKVHFKTPVQALLWPNHEVMAFLKNGSCLISLHDGADLHRMETEYRVVFSMAK